MKTLDRKLYLQKKKKRENYTYSMIPIQGKKHI